MSSYDDPHQAWARISGYAIRINELANDLDHRQKLLELILDEAVGRWHETCPNEERSLAEWLGVSDESFADYVTSGDPVMLEPRDPARLEEWFDD